VTEYRRDLAKAHANLGVAYRNLRYANESVKQFQKVLEYGGQLEKDEPNVEIEVVLAQAALELAKLARMNGNFASSLEFLQQSRSQIDSALARDSTNALAKRLQREASVFQRLCEHSVPYREPAVDQARALGD
jgi:tetratricopeptide (TPR) repeat protein